MKKLLLQIGFLIVLLIPITLILSNILAYGIFIFFFVNLFGEWFVWYEPIIWFAIDIGVLLVTLGITMFIQLMFEE